MLFRGTASSDTLLGGDEADTIYGGGAEAVPLDLADTIFGGVGNDLLYGNGGDDFVLGQQDGDTVYGGAGNDSLYGGVGITDTTDGADAIYGHVGSDWLYGNAGNDTLHGGDDADTIYGGLGGDLIYTDNTYTSNAFGADWVAGGAGSDTIYGGGGNDSLFGGDGMTDPLDAGDVIDGGSGSDVIYGNGGDDSLIGGLGNDTIFGGAGADTIIGGEGVDTIVADAQDVIYGGVGIDRFILQANGFSAQAVTDNATLQQLQIKDLEAGEFLEIRNLGGRNPTLGTDANGNAIILIDGQTFATLENINTSQLMPVTNSNNTQIGFTVTSNTNNGGGGGASNAAPALADLDAVTFLENTVNASAQIIDSAVTFADADNANLADGNLTVTYSVGGGAEDSLSVRHQGNGAGQIGFDGTTIRYAGTAIGTIGTNGASGANLVVTFNTNATPTAVDALIQNLTYANSSNTPTATREISITVNDGDGGTSAAAASLITVTAEAEAAAGAATFALSSLNGTTGFRLEGIDAFDNSGFSVASAGDVNGDGFADVIVGAYVGDPGGDINAGESYVVFGKASGWATSLDLSTLDGDNGFRLDGINAGDFFGYSVASAGDVNGDGFDDVIVGARQADPGGDSIAGESYVIFGKPSWAADIDLTTLDGNTGFRLDGIDSSDNSGASVSSAGDVNGDGFEDFIIGAWGGDPGGDYNAGESYVVFGKTAGWGVAIDLATLDGTIGFSLEGIDADDRSGFSVASAGDVNGDGFDDMIVGARASPGGDTYAGEGYVVFGKAAGWGVAIDLATLDGNTGFRLDGIDAFDFSGRRVASAGDVNGDGFDDVIVGAWQSDPGGDNDAGESYVVFGKAAGWGVAIDLATLDGNTGFRLDGIDAYDFSGWSVSSAGDVNGDGLDDMIVGARASPGGNTYAGESYVVFGKVAGWTANIDLNSLNGTTGFRLDGVAAGDYSGWSVASAGDVNGDGFDDVIIGAKLADLGGDINAGESYVIFGNNDSGAATAVGTNVADTISGTMAADVIVAGLGNDVVSGFDGNDVIKGANGDDALYGNAGTDKLFGGNGADTLVGGAGVDTLTGGDGIDRFVYTATTDTGDVIVDFNASADLLVFSGLLTGAFSFVGAHGNAFAGGGNSSARFNDTTKLLEVDTDGDAAADMSVTLKGVELANLSAADFSWS